jgi:hypothetical protein
MDPGTSLAPLSRRRAFDAKARRGEIMIPKWTRMSTLAVLGSVLAVAPAAALDTPVVVPIASKPGSVRLMVEAGQSGAPAGFTVDRMLKVEYELLGGWPASPQGSLVSGEFTGTPTFNTEGTAGDYTLGVDEAIEVELGQLFDETGVTATNTDELSPNTEYVIRVKANGLGAQDPASDYTTTMTISSAPLAANCTYTQGYWKNHTGVWPVSSLTLGTVNYSAIQLLAILQEPAEGNPLLILAHQLIAAKLNIANGADPSAAVAMISAADAEIGNQVCPPIGGGSLSSSPAVDYANALDDFNNGLVGPGHCGTTPATASTWGSVKATYRR